MKNFIKKIFYICVLLGGCLSLSAQTVGKYRIQLTDKNKTSYSLKKPLEYLSEKSLNRRIRQELPVDSTDLPVCKKYLKRIAKHGVKVLHTSKWNNTVLVQCPDSLIIDKIRKMPFVKDVRKVGFVLDSIAPRKNDRKELLVKDTIPTKMDSFYGYSASQVQMLGVDSLHLAGYRGEGMTIAVIDGGYFNVDTLPLLKHVKIAGIRDFVNPESDIYAEHTHGTHVLSCMAANTPYILIGTAPEASYWLLRSEDTDSEQLVELDNWVAALEFADSIGADLVNTSLGYALFDDKSWNFNYQQLDGKSVLASRAASMAASKGLLLVCSAGNFGNDPWKKITPPGDAEHVLTVGAVDSNRLNANFSSVGNTVDGRVKPDVMAHGVRTVVTSVKGGLQPSSGTSFASPLMCGGVACLWQALPNLTAFEVIDLVRKSGDRADMPDNIFGYGIPDLWKAYELYKDK